MVEPHPIRILRLRPDLDWDAHDGATTLRMGTRAVVLGPLPPSGRSLMERLAEGLGETELPGLPAPQRYWVDRLDRAAALSRLLSDSDHPLLCAHPRGEQPSRWGTTPAEGTRLRLSRFAQLRRDDTRLVFDTPSSPVQVEVLDLSLLADVVGDRPIGPQCPPALGAALAMLRAQRVLVAVHDGGEDDDDRHGLGGWTPNALRSYHDARRGYDDAPRGKPADHAPTSGLARTTVRGTAIALPRPSIDELRRTDPPLAEVMEARHSERLFAMTPPSIDAVAELLYRTVRSRQGSAPTNKATDGRDNRPHPSAGGLYPLQTYLMVDRCEGLARGVYHYHGQSHALGRLQTLQRDATSQLDEAMHSLGAAQRPPIVVVLVARVDRGTAMYGPLAYSLLLKDVGVVMQSMYLAATAIGLGCCALGTGNSPRLAAMAELGPHEHPVGELVIGVPGG